MFTIILIALAIWFIGGSFLSKYVWIPYFQRKLDQHPSFELAQQVALHEKGAIIADVIVFVVCIGSEPMAFFHGSLSSETGSHWGVGVTHALRPWPSCLVPRA